MDRKRTNVAGLTCRSAGTRRSAFFVAQVSKPAVSPISKSASHTTTNDLQVWKVAIGSLAPDRLAWWALPSLRSANPFRGFPNRSSQHTWKSALPPRLRACVLECGGKRSATPLSEASDLSNGTSRPIPKRCHSHRTPGPCGGSDDSRTVSTILKSRVPT